MPTTKDEWAALYGRILSTWPQTDWPSETLHIYFEDLHRCDPFDIEQAIRLLGKRLDFAPTLRQLRDAAEEARLARMRVVERLTMPHPTSSPDVIEGGIKAWWCDVVRHALADDDPGPALIEGRRRAVALFGERDWYDDEVARQAQPRVRGMALPGLQGDAAGTDAGVSRGEATS